MSFCAVNSLDVILIPNVTCFRIDLLAVLQKSLDRALFLYNLIREARSSGVRCSITIMHIRKFFKLHHNIVRFRLFPRIAKTSIDCRYFTSWQLQKCFQITYYSFFFFQIRNTQFRSLAKIRYFIYCFLSRMSRIFTIPKLVNAAFIIGDYRGSHR